MSTPDDCGYNDCVLSLQAGSAVDNFSKITQTSTGSATLDSSMTINIGTGSYQWKCGFGFTPGTSKIFTIQISDNCQAPNVISARNYADISKVQFQDTNTGIYQVTTTISSFMTFSDATSRCQFDNCKLVDSTSSTCGATTPGSYFTLTQSGTSVTLRLDTLTVRLWTYFCVQCLTNDLTPTVSNSLPFRIQVTAFDCSGVNTVKTVGDKTEFKVQSTSSQWIQVISQTEINTNTLSSRCPMTYTLLDAATGTPYTGTNLQIDSTTGVIQANRWTLFSQQLKIQLTSINGYQQITNSFTINVVCPGMTQYQLQQAYTFVIAATYKSPSFQEFIKDTDFISYTSCVPTTFSLLDGVTNNPYSSALLSIDSSTGKVSVDTMVVSSHYVKIKYLYVGTYYTTNAFKVDVICNTIQPNNFIENYLYYMPNTPATSLTQVTVATQYHDIPSNNVSCPMFYSMYDLSTGTQLLDNSFLSLNKYSGLLTVDTNIVDTKSIAIWMSYASKTWKTNIYTVTVICPPFSTSSSVVKPIQQYYKLFESSPGYIYKGYIDYASLISKQFQASTCRWCDTRKSYRLVHASNSSLYTDNRVQLDSNFNIITSTDQYLSDMPLKMQLYSTDAYCNSFFGNQQADVFVEVCGNENVVVTQPNNPFNFTSIWYIEPNYQLTNLTSVFSLDRVTQCKIVYYELWNSTREILAMKGRTVWAQFIKVYPTTGVVTVNHNNKPVEANYNSTYQFYLVAFTVSGKLGFIPLTFNFIYPKVNEPPKFRDSLQSALGIGGVYRLIVREIDQKNGYDDPIEEFITPFIEDPEKDKIIITTSLLNMQPCGCVNATVEEYGTRTRIKIKIDKSRVTQADQFENGFKIRMIDQTYPQSQQENIEVLHFRIYYMPLTPPSPAKPDRWRYQHDFKYNHPGQNVSAYIHYISVHGLMEIRFNASMNTYFNWTAINSSLVDIYMIPDNPEPGYNISRWNLTWNVTNYEGNSIFIQLKFNDTTAISQHIDQDRIVWHLKNFSQGFFSDEANNYLHHDYWTLSSRVRKQLGDQWRVYMQIAETNIYVIKAMFLFTYFMAMLPTGMNFRYFMWYLRSLQLVVHLPMLHVIVPGNVSRYLEVVKPIVVYDYLPSYSITTSLFKIDLEKQRSLNQGIVDQMEDLGYATHNSMLILGSIWIYVVFYLLKMFVFYAYKVGVVVAKYFRDKDIIEEGGQKHIKTLLDEEETSEDENQTPSFCCCSISCPRTHWSDKTIKQMIIDEIRNSEKSVFWTMIIQLMIEPYMEWAIAAKLNANHKVDTYFGDSLSNWIGVVCTIIAFILVPSLMLNLYNVPLKKIRTKQHTERFGVMFYDIRNRVWYHAFYILFLTIRRLLFLEIAFDLGHEPSLQMWLMGFCNLGMHFYIGLKPMQSKVMNWLHFLEEQVILACCAHMVVFMMSDDEEVDIGYGWSMIIIMNLHFLVVSIYMMYLTKEFLRVLCKRHSNPWKVWAVRRFGFRIGGKLHNMFTIHTGKRKVEQMMELGINQGTDDLTLHLKQYQYESDKKIKEMLNHLPHMIERNSKMQRLQDPVQTRLSDHSKMTPRFGEYQVNQVNKVGSEDYTHSIPMAQKDTILKLTSSKQQDYQYTNYWDYVDASFNQQKKPVQQISEPESQRSTVRKEMQSKHRFKNFDPMFERNKRI